MTVAAGAGESGISSGGRVCCSSRINLAAKMSNWPRLLELGAPVGSMNDQHRPVERQQDGAIVNEPGRVDQVLRSRPRPAIVVQGKTVPDLACAAGQRMVAHQQPDPALIVGGDPGQALAHSQMAPRLFQRASGLHQLPAREALDADGSVLIKRITAILHRHAIRVGIRVVFAPLFVTFLISDPEPAATVASQAAPRLEARRACDRDRVGWCSHLAQPHVVVSAVVGVPGDENAAMGIGCDGRTPVVGPAVRDRPGLPPRVAAGQGHGHDVVVVAPPGLPGQPDNSAGIGGRNHVKVRSRGAAQANYIGHGALTASLAGCVAPGKDVPVAALPLSPGHPDGSLAVDGHGRPPDLQASLRDIDGGPPGLAVKLPQANPVAVAGGAREARRIARARSDRRVGDVQVDTRHTPPRRFHHGFSQPLAHRPPWVQR